MTQANFWAEVMDYFTRPVTQQDELFLWQMLYEAAHMAEERLGFEVVAGSETINRVGGISIALCVWLHLVPDYLSDTTLLC